MRDSKTLGAVVSPEEYVLVNGLCELMQIHVSCALRTNSVNHLLDLAHAIDESGLRKVPRVNRKPRVRNGNCPACS